MPRIIKEYNRLPPDVRRKVKQLNDLSGKEWVQRSKSIMTFGGHIARKRRLHGAAFPIELAKQFIQLFTKKGDVVLDPFIGVGTVADACTLLGRRCIGFEINKEFYELAIEGPDPIDGQHSSSTPADHSIYLDTCLNLRKYVPPESVDLVLTSPPYAHLLHKVAEHFAGYQYEKNIYRNEGRRLAKPHSENSQDMGNLDWNRYQKQIRRLMKLLYNATRPGGFNVWVVRDFRDVEDHLPYVNLHSKIVELAAESGWILTDIGIWDQTSQRKLVKLGGPKARRFYLNIGHSFILIFRKNLPGERFVNL